MKKISIPFLFFCCLTFVSCSRPKETSQSRFALHTTVSLTLFDGEPDSFFDEFYQVLEKENSLVTNWLSTSYASKISAAAGLHPVEVREKRLLDFLQKVVQFSKDSHGKFNVLIAPLTYLWGVGTANPRVPSKKEIEDALALLDLDKVIFEANTVYLVDKGMSLDVGGVGKGYLIDYMVDWLKSKGVKKAILNLGGSLYLLGDKATISDWSIGIREPRKEARDYMALMNVATNQSVSTSGCYERFFEDEGRHYHHILDPNTGYPVKGDLAFVTVVLPCGLEADYYSTLGLVLGLQEGVRVMEEKKVPSVFVTKDGIVHLVGIKAQDFKILNDYYRLK